MDSLALQPLPRGAPPGGLDLCFVVGGPYGLELDEVDHRLSLGDDHAAAPARPRRPARAALPRATRSSPASRTTTERSNLARVETDRSQEPCETPAATAAVERLGDRRTARRRRPEGVPGELRPTALERPGTRVRATTRRTPRCCSRRRSGARLAMLADRIAEELRRCLGRSRARRDRRPRVPEHVPARTAGTAARCGAMLDGRGAVRRGAARSPPSGS